MEGKTLRPRENCGGVQRGVSDSPSSNLQGVQTLLTPPTDLTVTAVSSTQLSLSWTNLSQFARYCTYSVEQSSDGTTWQQIGSLSGSDTQSYTYTATGPFSASTTYFFRVQARLDNYNANYSPIASVTIPASPSQPILTSVTAESDAAIALQWDDVDDESGYRIERLADGTWTSVGTVAAETTTFTDAGLTEATSYTYRVVATSTFGDSMPSATSSVTTLPSAPSDLSAMVISDSQIDLTWANHSTIATTYYIEESTDGSTWQTLGSVLSTATSYTLREHLLR